MAPIWSVLEPVPQSSPLAMGVSPQTLQVVGTGVVPPHSPARYIPLPGPGLCISNILHQPQTLQKPPPAFFSCLLICSLPQEQAWRTPPGGTLINNLGTLLPRVCHTLLQLVSGASQLQFRCPGHYCRVFQLQFSSGQWARAKSCNSDTSYMHPTSVCTSACLLFCATAAVAPTSISPARN